MPESRCRGCVLGSSTLIYVIGYERIAVSSFWAALTIVQAWIAHGKPEGQESLGSYEAWAGVVGGILEVADINGFLANRDRVYAEAQDEVINWGEFFAAWWSEFQDQIITSNQLFGLCVRHRLLLKVIGGRDERSARTRLGINLSHMRDRIIGEFRIYQLGQDTHTKAQEYRLSRVGAEGAEPCGGFLSADEKNSTYICFTAGHYPPRR